ncbi:peptidase S41 [Sphingomonas parva]|uniref:Peptidase S41 n=1 Tax=Sphingomonas parva TaxID=2555898 RepID=A0A4Y8ZTZ4_9SPHN|nr:S41 family peptidase [Sphingomonas parva]TFI58615.1 peptidase S41 [Sphingomonas parva]
MMLTRRSMLRTAAAAAVTSVAAAAARASAASAPELLATGAMRSDLDLLLHAFEAVHPGLGRYLPPGGFKPHVAAAGAWAARERSLAEMFLMLTRLTAAVRCGHTYANPNNQTERVQAALFGRPDRLPLAFRWIGGRAIVTGGRGGAAPLPPGSELLAIDGVPSQQLLARMLPLSRADGGNDGKRLSQLGLGAHERMATFDVLRSLWSPATGGVIPLRVRMPDGRERTLELPGRTEAALQESRRETGLGWRFEIDRDGVGRLTMPDWVTYRSKWNWRAYLDAAVDRLVDERARGLVVDLRGNEGGTECGWHLLARLVERDTPLPRFARRTRYRRLPDALRPPLDTWDARFRDWGETAAGPDEHGWFALDDGDEEGDLVRPRGRRFAGQVAVLVDAACSSATFQFANAVRETGLARLIGEPTGGNLRGINGGGYFFVRLPATGLEVDLPIVGYFPAGPRPDRGVVPHDPGRVARHDIVHGRDRALALALARLA